MMRERPPRSLRSRLPLTRGRLIYSPPGRGRSHATFNWSWATQVNQKKLAQFTSAGTNLHYERVPLVQDGMHEKICYYMLCGSLRHSCPYSFAGTLQRMDRPRGGRAG